MFLPEGYEESTGKRCRLQKSISGLKQAPLCWNKHFSNFLKSYGLTALATKKCIFICQETNLYLAKYVNQSIKKVALLSEN